MKLTFGVEQFIKNNLSCVELGAYKHIAAIEIIKQQ
jgi:hypothetical protein